MRKNGVRPWNLSYWGQATWVLLAALSTMPIDRATADGEEPGAVTHNADPRRLSQAFRHTAEQVWPAIVTIETLSGPRKTPQWAMRETPLRGSHRALDAQATCPHCSTVDHARDGTGSGIIIDRRGFILTCHHVIADADTVFVRLPDGRRLEPAEIYADAFTDLAVIRIVGAGDLSEARLGDSDKVAVGEWAISVGNPYGLGPSVSAGIVSATNRELPDTPWTRLIQSDAASNPGNSGGALVNLRGEVIGISEGGYGAGEGFQGIGFAIPVNAARRVARQLIEHGEVRRAYLGCHTEMLRPDVAQYLGLPQGSGLIIGDVTPQSPAAVAGIQVGDVLIRFSGMPVRDAYHMHQLLEDAQPDRRYTITVFRDGDMLSMNVRLGRWPARPETDRTSVDQRPDQPPRYSDVMLGLMLDDVSPETARQLGYKERNQGVLITHVAPGQVAYREGICAGMVILRVDNRPTPNLAEYRRAINNQSLEKGVLMIIGTPQRNHFVVFRREKRR